MGSLSIWHWLIVLLVVVMIFGTKKLQQHGLRPGRRREGLQGRHEGRLERPTTPTAPDPAQVSAASAADKSTIDVEARQKS